jgi:hypothetical protein
VSAIAIAQLDLIAKMGILVTARLLGMQQYTQHVECTCTQYLTECFLGYEEIDLVEREPLWTAMVNSLAYGRWMGFVPDLEEFAGSLDRWPRLKVAMEEADVWPEGGKVEEEVGGREGEVEGWGGGAVGGNRR